ncbi:Alpha-N-acetylglucosaminidase [Ananas comosus]|uniref:Alpha-N-acetylglucosaminidase n=1 Tax=Ananas comosus TaxID=4615 RepID=A0A199UZ87_ANACO|nr:Alpha-N-acetylglucosaminidase [Ananas comosus]
MEESKMGSEGTFRAILAILQWWGFNVTVIIMNKWIFQGICGESICFRISNIDNSSRDAAEILIEGTTAVELSSGLHWYLKYWTGAHISWDKTGGVQIASVPSPGSLPRVDAQSVKVERPVPWNYYQNVVTSSYSFVWWDWKRWEKEIDWMALQGVNLPLAFTGQEAIWQKGFNVSSEDLYGFFGGPAFLAWSRMGNLHGWGGPLSQNWLDQQLKLQKRILSHMVELGMTPGILWMGIRDGAVRIFLVHQILCLLKWERHLSSSKLKNMVM